MRVSVGIAVHKTSFVVSHDGARATSFPTTARGTTRLVTQLGHPDRIVCEPSGGYERPLLAALQAAGRSCPAPAGARLRARRGSAMSCSTTRTAQPRLRARRGSAPPRRPICRGRPAPSRAQGISAKFAPLAARVLARVGTVLQPRLTPVPDPAPVELQALTTRRHQRQEMRSADQQRLAELPELGTRDGKAIASLIGVAPCVRPSGGTRGPARIGGAAAGCAPGGGYRR